MTALRMEVHITKISTQAVSLGQIHFFPPKLPKVTYLYQKNSVDSFSAVNRGLGVGTGGIYSTAR